ncbi:sodium-dependent transporter [Pseudoflavonifractor phocaeensis]|uniref:sodium-dependent transporter n=1 Tax=Pseudoflavonifractor phocaeensis TaxID=1870988 RepID=UPI00313CE726
MKERETFASRLGFVLISAGCAIGLGNVWRFPYIVGQYGGAAFVLVYLFFLVIMGLPIMAMEFSVGRASRKSIAVSFHALEPKGTKWHWYSWFGMAGNYMLMMFYTTVAGWMLLYFVKMAKGDFVGLDPAGVGAAFDGMLANPGVMLAFMALVVLLGMAVCGQGLRGGVEKITKVMMLCLLALLVILAIRAVTLPGAAKGLEFYLMPDFKSLFYTDDGKFRLGEVIFAAMGQAFFTLSLGIGAMAIFGSYIGKEQRLLGEAVNVTILDTFVAFVAGLIIFPSAFAFGVTPDAGPSLIFVTLPNIFNAMPGGRLWGALFFLFMSFAAMSTIIAVFENIISFPMDKWGWSRKKSVAMNLPLIFVLSLPCLLGFNLWGGVSILGGGIMDFEDFILSNNLLPLGSLIYLLFCVSKSGWGWDNFLSEANEGQGLRFPKGLRAYMKWVVPIMILFIFLMGYKEKFFPG